MIEEEMRQFCGDGRMSQWEDTIKGRLQKLGGDV